MFAYRILQHKYVYFMVNKMYLNINYSNTERNKRRIAVLTSDAAELKNY